MKRLLILTLALMLLLCACGKTEDPPVTTTEGATTETTLETTENTEAPPVNRHPLTGEVLDAPFSGRTVAVSIGNTKAALPQHGISQADVFYEIEAEGGITRFLPIFTNVADVSTIGPIRSARTFFNSVAASYNGPIAHCGGSVRGIAGYHDKTGSKITDWLHIDQFQNGKYFFRDMDRYNYQGYAWEHCLFVKGPKLQEAMDAKEYTNIDSLDFGYRFDENVSLNGEAATEVKVSFLGGKVSTLTYDEATGLYAIEQYDRKLIDGTNGDQLTFKNLLVLYADQSKQHDGHYSRSYYEIIGSGDGYFAVNGKIVKIKWSREDVKKPFVYTLEDGSPVTLGVGKSYVGISSPKSDLVSYK